ncbi:hypothetical protein IHE71_15855 [Myceligenerans sp. TRM 65318]|uniref:Uncharacterized protein n=2 Tax=Myceligenerans pegani TaxID=2776917 RepID=A0ABR9N0I5_9MICO|nr:hypothetical protein [Myceligenerans sp. TRM 65318]MBE1877168.1 hypothetical protein [Myceligenerans sp. TRM 65318]
MLRLRRAQEWVRSAQDLVKAALICDDVVNRRGGNAMLRGHATNRAGLDYLGRESPLRGEADRFGLPATARRQG